MTERPPAPILIIGATSAIAVATARQLAARGHPLILAARNQAALREMAAELKERFGVEPICHGFDALDFDSHPKFVEAAWTESLEGAIVCHGVLPNQKQAEQDFAVVRRTFEVNLLSVISLVEPLAARMEQRQRGWIAVVSSVAGDRGRQSNYIYGASKAGLSAYLEGVRNRLHSSGVQVLTVKPGFVYSPMTAAKLDPRSPLVATPEKVARDMIRAIDRRRNVIYTPWYWRLILLVFKVLPEPIFKRLKF